MQTIMYAGDEYLTGDEIAYALLNYSRALGEENHAQVVEIPVREEDGSIARAKFLIGPASQIVAKSTPGHGPELEDEELVRQLKELTRNVESPRSLPMEAPENPTPDVD
ncbi:MULTISPECIES: hypothetical protein [unclassified Microbacterium]|uniref:hypothetical protein n=1 Tax=unclassified Microbacterium TaxID=2609290 RepID=UPI000EAA8022|nr:MULTISPECIES: hypothetical protein [unclassified Microbacterium]MBT2483521.1 hypothetical protein [Microbacterium sp. ISL-108]RKN66536.1 hypothetical protein D7252_02285 [Microbacterium sp. CGR2]